MVNATHRGTGPTGPGTGHANGTWRQALRLAAAALAFSLAALSPGADALAQSKKKGEAPAQPDTAAVQRAYANGTKAFESGDMAGAEQQLSAALAGGGLPNSQMARALYLRGAALRQLGKPARAISDLTTALWLKGGLSDTDKAKATEERQLAYREAGLGETPPPIGAAPLDQATKSAAATHTPASGAQVVQVTEQSFWSNFSLPSLTGSSQPAQPTAATVQTADGQQQQSSFWSFLSPGSSEPAAGAAASPQPATTMAAAVTPGADAASQASAPSPGAGPGPSPVAVAEASAPAAESSWSTETAAAAEASAAQQLSAGYAPATDTSGVNPLAVQSDGSVAPAVSNPLAGTGTAVSNFFGNLFGSSGTTPTPAVATGSTDHSTQWGPETTVVTAQTSSMVQRGPDSPPPASPAPDVLPWGTANAPAGAQKAAAPAKKVAAARAGGKYKLQVAAVRSREEAERLAQTLHGYQPVREGMVSPEIDEAVIGSMGTFYRVRLGPYADANEPNQLCKTLRPQGFDCLVVTQ